jgi:hypothetical protein
MYAFFKSRKGGGIEEGWREERKERRMRRREEERGGKRDEIGRRRRRRMERMKIRKGKAGKGGTYKRFFWECDARAGSKNRNPETLADHKKPERHFFPETPELRKFFVDHRKRTAEVGEAS